MMVELHDGHVPGCIGRTQRAVEKHGFQLAVELEGRQWSTEVFEQRFERGARGRAGGTDLR